MDVERAISRLGKWGRWQMIYYVVLSTATCFTGCWHMLAIVFIGYIPEYHCQMPPGHTNESIPLDKDNKTDHCNYYVNISIGDSSTDKCTSWEYDSEPGPTIVTEWDLVCDKDVMKEMAQTIMVIGVMVGAMLFTFLSDNLGRKPVFLFAHFGSVAIGFLTSFVNDYYLFCVLRFIAGMLQQGIVLPGFIMACEMFPANMRTFAGIAIENFWAVGMCLMALFAYLIRNWHYYQMLISLLGLFTIPLVWVLPESVPWLCANNRVSEAEEILHRAAKFNNVSVPEHLLKTKEEFETMLETKKEEKKSKGPRSALAYVKQQFKTETDADGGAKYTILDVLRNKRLFAYATIMCFLWMVISLVYYGLSLSTSNLAGDPYLNFFFSGLVEIPAYSISIFFLETFGRRYPLAAYQIVAGIALALTMVVPNKTADGTSLLPLVITLNMIGKFGITGAFGIVFLYAPEIFPTTLRAQAMGIASVGGRIGNCLAPFSAYVGRKVPWLPGVLFGSLSIAGGVITLLLPETRNRPLPQTIEDIENWSKTPPGKPSKELEKKDNGEPLGNHEMQELNKDEQC